MDRQEIKRGQVQGSKNLHSLDRTLRCPCRISRRYVNLWRILTET